MLLPPMSEIPKKLNVKSAGDLFTNVLPKPKLERVQLPDGGFNWQAHADTSVSFFSLVYAWLYWNLANETTHAIAGGNPMDSKLWYASKTLWVNVLGLAWFWLGPVVGIPTLTPEVTITALGIINLLLRIVTKKEVTFS